MPEHDDHGRTPQGTTDEFNTQFILQALATDPDVGKLCSENPGLTEDRVRECLREASDWAARDFVEPTLREKILNAWVLPFFAAVVALSYHFMVPLVSGWADNFGGLDLGMLPYLSRLFVEWHQQTGWLVALTAVLALLYLLWACRRRRRLAFFRRSAGILTGLYAAWVILAALLPLICVCQRISA